MSKLNAELKDALAVVINDPDNGLVEMGEKKTPGIRLILAIVEGPHEGETIEWIGWLTDGAFEGTLKRLNEAFGFGGNFAEVAEMPDLFAGQQCKITTEFETYQDKTRLKVKWLNPKDGTGGGTATMAPQEARSLASTLTARAKALMKAAGKTAATKPAPAPAAKSTGGAVMEEDEIPWT